jgi:hypothetical protein
VLNQNGAGTNKAKESVPPEVPGPLLGRPTALSTWPARGGLLCLLLRLLEQLRGHPRPVRAPRMPGTRYPKSGCDRARVRTRPAPEPNEGLRRWPFTSMGGRTRSRRAFFWVLLDGRSLGPKTNMSAAGNEHILGVDDQRPAIAQAMVTAYRLPPRQQDPEVSKIAPPASGAV